ncbi:MAG: hypothetical protein JHD16_04870 [Solirubrobacteraceae bacterium]|nr:hypothetical protein [Solirubrobacteraceae bacterium]
MTRFASDEVADFGGDVNGDGRPEVIVNNQFDERPRPKLIVSSPTGAATPIPIRADVDDFELIVNSVPDLDGDGRDELQAGASVIVTDALAAAALPSRIDFRSVRPISRRDIDLGIATSSSALSGLLTADTPRGTVPDSTGDGRPEIVLAQGTIAAIFPSQAIVPGVRSRLAQTYPLALLDDISSEDISPADAANLERRDIQAQFAANGAEPVVVGGRLVNLAPADAAASVSGPRTFRLTTYAAGPLPLATASFSATGIPLLLDHDPASGDSLVALFERASCGRRQRCLDRVLRVSATGSLRSVVAARRNDDDLYATFITDGPDADALVDVAISRGTRSSPRRALTAGDGGTIAILTSAQTGSTRLSKLPVLSRGRTPIRVISPPTSQVLPNGSRWLGAQTSERRRDRTGVFSTLAQRR